ncbi:MAG: polyphosphate kinase 2 [Nitrospirales bacterium]
MGKKTRSKKSQAKQTDPPKDIKKKLSRKEFNKEMNKLQVELCRMQRWVKENGLRVIIVFEGRDAAGKGGVIKRITERVSPRVFRVVALPAPSDREKSQLYAQRYISHFPSAGEVILFDRSWYNRAGVEKVMGFCTDQEYERFLRVAPGFERDLVEQGIILVKYFFDVSQEVQQRRFLQRAKDPLRHWKLSPMDVESWKRWWDYTRAYVRMIETTDSEWAPWYQVQADDKRSARLNCIAHLLSMVPYKRIPFQAPKFDKQKPPRPGTPKHIKFEHSVPLVY